MSFWRFLFSSGWAAIVFVRLGAPDVVAAEVMSAKFCDFSRIEAKNRTTTTALAEGLDERATGTRKVLILRPAFKDDSNDPFPPGREGLLDEVAGFYATNSYHKLMLEFTISPLLPLAEDKSFYLNRNYDLQVDVA